MRSVQPSSSHCWRVGSTALHVFVGDLFEPEVDAIVNSEQTDFVLSPNPSTISGQIQLRLGDVIQGELDDQTQGQSLPPGTVLTTSGGGRYRRIYHAGFHDPYDWLSSDEREQQEGDALRTIASCVRAILAEVDGKDVRSVAFPLLGTGLFGLDPGVIAYEFARQVASVGLSGDLVDRHVWLVVRDDVYPCVIDPTVQGVIDANQGFSPISDLESGVVFLDIFNRRQVHSGDARFLAWMLTRYAELLVSYLMFRLAVAAGDDGRVQRLLPAGKSLSFGVARVEAQLLALTLRDEELSPGWPRFIRDKLLHDKQLCHRLQRINEDRNKLAHGKKVRSATEIEADLRSFIAIEDWAAARRDFGDPDLDSMQPWVSPVPQASGSQETASDAYGILDRWTSRGFDYLAPASGRTFRRSAIV